MNPFDESTKETAHTIYNSDGYRAGNKYDVDGQTRARIILANAAMSDAFDSYHALARIVNDRDVFKELSLMHDGERESRRLFCTLMPKDEKTIERAIFCEQLEIELFAALASRKIQRRVRTTINSVLVDDLDHLYRFSNLLHLTDGTPAETLVPLDVLPSRPTYAQITPLSKAAVNPVDGSDIPTVLAVMLSIAVKRYAATLYRTSASLPRDDLSRGLFAEVSTVEEHHLTRLGGLLPQKSTFERLLLTAYCECYALYSCGETETDARLKAAFEKAYRAAVKSLKTAATLLQNYEGKNYAKVISPCDFPPPISLTNDVGYVRAVLAATDLSSDAPQDVRAPSSEVIRAHIDRYNNHYTCKRD